MNSVRDRETFKDIMDRLYGEIKQKIDAAGIICDENLRCDPKCPFNDEFEPDDCDLYALKIILKVDK